MKSIKFKTISIFLSVLLILNIGISGLSFASPPMSYYVGGKVWYDTNGNGIQDTGEGRVNGVWIRVFKLNNTHISSVATNHNGLYAFHLAPEEYIIRFDETTVPNGYFATKRLIGNDRTIDSDGSRVRVKVINSNNFTFDLGLTNKPYNVRVTEKIYVYDSSFDRIGALYRNAIKTVYGSVNSTLNGEYYKVWYNGDWGFIKQRSTDNNMIKQLEYNVRINPDSNQIVYKYAGNQQLGTLPISTIKTVYGKRLSDINEKYYRIWYNGNPAYIKADGTEKLDYNVRITDKTVVRQYPNGPALLGNLYKNRIKTAYGYRTDNNGVMWYRVWHNGGPGYVYKLVTSRNLGSVSNFNVRTNVALNVRSGVWGSVLGTLPANTVKTVYGQRLDRDGNTWYRVWYNGGPGYIRAKYTTEQ